MAETLENGHGVHVIDAMPPREMALACEAAGAAKAGRDALALVVLGVLQAPSSPAGRLPDPRR